jgi:hypothetical protein
MFVRLVALAASLALLAGCAPTPALPAPLTQAEVKKRLAQQNAQWWSSMFPDEPVPAVDPVEYLPMDEAGRRIVACLKDANIEGLLFGPDQSWIYLGDDPAGNDEVNRQYFVCSLQYPTTVNEVRFLSDAELEWIFYYNRDRLVPCLQLLGFTVRAHSGEYLQGSGDFWIPYYEMFPIPSASEWERVDLRCPPSPVGPLYRPTDE